MASRSNYDTVARAYADGVRSLLTPTLSAADRLPLRRHLLAR